MKTRHAVVALALLGSMAVAAPAFAWHRAHVGVGLYFGVPVGGYYYPPYSPYYYPPYSYYPYPAPVVVPAQPQTYVEQPQAPAAQAQPQGYWYYCAGSNAYYPYVKECPGGWQRVSPQPAQ